MSTTRSTDTQDRLGGVVELGKVDIVHPAHALAARTHAARATERLLDRLALALTALDGDRT